MKQTTVLYYAYKADVKHTLAIDKLGTIPHISQKARLNY